MAAGSLSTEAFRQRFLTWNRTPDLQMPNTLRCHLCFQIIHGGLAYMPIHHRGDLYFFPLCQLRKPTSYAWPNSTFCSIFTPSSAFAGLAITHNNLGYPDAHRYKTILPAKPGPHVPDARAKHARSLGASFLERTLSCSQSHIPDNFVLKAWSSPSPHKLAPQCIRQPWMVPAVYGTHDECAPRWTVWRATCDISRTRPSHFTAHNEIWIRCIQACVVLSR